MTNFPTGTPLNIARDYDIITILTIVMLFLARLQIHKRQFSQTLEILLRNKINGDYETKKCLYLKIRRKNWNFQ